MGAGPARASGSALAAGSVLRVTAVFDDRTDLRATTEQLMESAAAIAGCVVGARRASGTVVRCAADLAHVRVSSKAPPARRIGRYFSPTSAKALLSARVANSAVLLWPVDEDGLVLGEDSYCPGVVSVTRLSREELPHTRIDLMVVI